MLKRSPVAVFPNLFIIARAIRPDNPECTTAPARINAPSIKKTGSFPNSAYVSFLSNIPSKGTVTIARRLVMASGSISVTHKIRQMTNRAIALCP